MKQPILSLTLVLIVFSSFCQTMSTEVKTEEYFLTKSHRQRTIGWVMLGGGVALTGIGIAVAGAETTGYALGNSKSGNAGSVLAIAGIASALGSIPLFISAAHNKHRAATVAFNMQRVSTLSYAPDRITLFQPALTLKILL